MVILLLQADTDSVSSVLVVVLVEEDISVVGAINVLVPPMIIHAPAMVDGGQCIDNSSFLRDQWWYRLISSDIFGWMVLACA
jgi:hypothetical protein